MAACVIPDDHSRVKLTPDHEGSDYINANFILVSVVLHGHVTSRHATLHHIMSRHATSRHTTSHHIASCHVTLCHVRSEYSTHQITLSRYKLEHDFNIRRVQNTQRIRPPG